MASGLGGVGQFRLWNDDTNDNRRGTPKPMRWFSTKEELNDFLTQKDRDKQLEQEVFADLADGDTSEKKVIYSKWVQSGIRGGAVFFLDLFSGNQFIGN